MSSPSTPISLENEYFTDNESKQTYLNELKTAILAYRSAFMKCVSLSHEFNKQTDKFDIHDLLLTFNTQNLDNVQYLLRKLD